MTGWAMKVNKYVISGLLVSLALVGIVVVSVVGRTHKPRANGSAGDVELNEMRPAGDARLPRKVANRKQSDLKKGDIRRDRIRRMPEEGDSEDDDNLSPAERRLMTAIEQGRDDDDLEQILKVLPEASVSTNVEIRAELVDALGWFGVQSMNHLLPFMADPDEDVRQSAIDNWTSAVGDVEDEKDRAQMIEAVMQVLNDKDALEFLTGELIGMDDKIAIQTLVDVIEGGKATRQATAVAREQYEFITGDEYTTIDAANQWLSENYDPPDSEESRPDVKGRK